MFANKNLNTKYWKCLEKICWRKVSLSWHFLSCLPIIAALKRIYDANKALNNGRKARSLKLEHVP